MKKILFISLLLLAGFVQTGFSHSYHYEVAVTTRFDVVKDQLQALKMTWLYDEEVSQVMLQDNKNLDVFKKKLIRDLGKLGYFTQIKINGKKVIFDKAKDVVLKKENKVLKLFFTLPLRTPELIHKGSHINVEHKDPTAIAILYYDNPSRISIEGAMKNRCKSSVKDKAKFEDGEFPQLVGISC